MKFIRTRITDLLLIERDIHIDSRGSFSRIFCRNSFDTNNLEMNFVQHNVSSNLIKGTVRGFHFQSPPYSEIKLVSCLSGSIYDIVIDLRKNSPTFLEKFEVILDSQNANSLLIPAGFAHGFQTLEDNSIVFYEHSEFYKPESYSGINHQDPLLKIKWPLSITSISLKDEFLDFLPNEYKGIEL